MRFSHALAKLLLGVALLDRVYSKDLPSAIEVKAIA